MQPDLKVLDLEAARNSDSKAAESTLTAPYMLSILNSTPDCVKMVELDGSVSYMNYNGMCAMEIDDISDIEGRQWCKLWPESSSPVIEAAIAKAKEGTSTRFEAPCATAKGSPRWWDVSVSPVRDAAGNVERILSISRDITEQIEREQRIRDSELQMKEIALAQAEVLQDKKKVLETQDVLMREIDHRVKNSLAMIASLLRMHANSSDRDGVREELNDASNRVLTVSRVHERLHQSSDVTSVKLDGYIEPLCFDIRDAVAESEVSLTADVDSITVPADQAVSIGLIVSELISNAFRHAFPDISGNIHVSCKALENGKTELAVCDNGVGIAEDFDLETASGLGMKIVRLYAMQLGGEVLLTHNGDIGTRFSITF